LPELLNTPCLLIIRDGWGKNPHTEHEAFNAVGMARTPVDGRLTAEYPSTLVRTNGEAVGLTDETMGNSEVGHQNIGAGRIVDQDAVRISKVCREGRLRDVHALVGPIVRALDAGKRVHLMGICSDAGVHGQLEHLEALLSLCRELGVPEDRVLLHMFTDGRDTGPFSGKGFIEDTETMCRAKGVGRIASVIGRYFAMDRDNRWERVARAYGCLTGRGVAVSDAAVSPSAAAALESYYKAPADASMKGDEFIPPTMIAPDRDAAMQTRVGDGDTVIFYNYRGDRPRELCSALLLPEFQDAQEVKPSPDSGERGFDRGTKLNLDFVIMTPYSDRLAELASVAFPKPPKMVNTLGEWLSKHGVGQFRCAETEKYPHVTFFFNDYRDEPFEGENREIVQSPRVATYDQQPEMSARGVTDAVLRRIAADDGEPVIIVNFANGDMVGHTGSLEAAVKACEVVDSCVGEIVDAALAKGGSAIVFADHGNAEQMHDPDTGSPHTAHTTYEVPLIVVAENARGRSLRAGGVLGDVAPTLLDLIGLEQPKEMTGRSLLGD